MLVEHFLAILTFIMQTMSVRDRRVITTLKYSKFRVKPTIVNGQPAERGQLPFLVSIKDPFQTTYGKRVWVNLCGGSIVSAKKVVTAAHCFETNNYFYQRYPTSLRIVAGSMLTNIYEREDKKHDPNEQWRTPIKVKVHENYYFPSNDIALVFIKEPWQYSDKVFFIRTARRHTDYPEYCVTAGYGRVGHGAADKASAVLLLARVGIISRRQCSSLWEMSMDDYICTHSVQADVSQGDSGGPLTCQGTVNPEDRGGYGILVGVVSGKNYDRTTLFTRVSVFHDWISENVAENLQSNIFFCCISLITFIC